MVALVPKPITAAYFGNSPLMVTKMTKPAIRKNATAEVCDIRLKAYFRQDCGSGVGILHAEKIRGDEDEKEH